MSDIENNTQHDNQPDTVTPRCPVCGGPTVLAVMHKSVQAALNVFRCTVCYVQYPVVKRPQADA